MLLHFIRATNVRIESAALVAYKRLARTRTYSLELHLAWSTLIYGLWILCPFLDTFDGNIAYGILAHLAPEWVIGLIVSVVGFIQVAALNVNSLVFRKWAAFIAFHTWVLICASYALSAIALAWVPTSALIAIANGIAFLRVSQLQREKGHATNTAP